MRYSFSKYAGCGNDFILFDNTSSTFPAPEKELIHSLCHRQWGIGADGVILLEKNSEADFGMRIFNADGSEAEMCGNGIRCLMKFILELGHSPQAYTIKTMRRNLKIELKSQNVCVEMGNPTQLAWSIMVDVDSNRMRLHHLDTGVPHAILFVDNVDEIDLTELGPKIRHHAFFQPQGANFNVATLQQDKIKIRTYERGVEAETLACGTGATAVALAAAQIYGVPRPIKIETQSKDLLEIDFFHENGLFSQVTMTGPARFIFKGEIKLPTAKLKL